MSENTRKKIVYACLIAAIIYGAAAIQIAATSHTSLDSAITDEMASARWGIDPFRARVTEESTQLPRQEVVVWVLDGIVYSDHSPMAIINKQMVRSGDTVGDARVIAIDQESATLEHKGKRFTLTVSKG